MSTQLTNGEWTETEKLDKALDTLGEHVKAGDAKRFFIGTKNEVEEEKRRVAIQEQVDNMQDKLDLLEAQQDQSLVAIPSAKEVVQFGILAKG